MLVKVGATASAPPGLYGRHSESELLGEGPGSVHVNKVFFTLKL